MFKEYWNGYIALGVAVGISLAFNIVGFLSVGFDWVGLEKATTNTYTYAEAQCSRQQAEQSASSAAFQSPEAATAEPQPDQGNAREHDEPDWCDLAAQQSMADSTAGMEQTAWIALLLTAIGVILVWLTLYYTKQTLREAQETTKAANASVVVAREVGSDQIAAAVKTADISRDIGQAQVRAYFAPHTIKIRAEEGSISFQAEVRNVGHSPAYFGHVVAHALVSKKGIDMIFSTTGFFPTAGPSTTQVATWAKFNRPITLDNHETTVAMTVGMFGKDVFGKAIEAFETIPFKVPSDGNLEKTLTAEEPRIPYETVGLQNIDVVLRMMAWGTAHLKRHKPDEGA